MTNDGHGFGSEPAEGVDSAPVAGTGAKTPEATLRTALLIYAAINAVSGVLFLALPRFIWDTIGGVEDVYIQAYDSTRMVGGVFIALAIGALLVARNPRGQNTLVTVMVIEAALAAVGGFWTLFADDAPTNLPLEILIPAASAAVAGYLGWARVKARRILGTDDA
ncbi:hypothetical protein HQ535_03215 [bacterium]|nr:hypothetical protein [bacterium]